MRISDWSSDVCSSDLTGMFVELGIMQFLSHSIIPCSLFVLKRVLGSDGPRAGALKVSARPVPAVRQALPRSEEHTSELQSLMRISYAVFCLKKKRYITYIRRIHILLSCTTKNI